jgi:hypothetical protein
MRAFYETRILKMRMWKLWRSRKRLLAVAYLVIGLVVADAHRYFTNISAFKAVLSAVLAVGLWPLVLFGVNLQIH